MRSPVRTGSRVRVGALIAVAAATLELAACGSARRATAGPTAGPLPPVSLPLLRNGISISFPGGTCSTVVGRPLTTWVVLNGGYPPYSMTWLVDGEPGGLDRLQVTHLGADTDPTLAHGTRYTITYTPRTPDDTIVFIAEDYRNGVPVERDRVPLVGGTSAPCTIEP